MSFIDVIKYEGDESSFVWKHPAEDFNMLSQLIVAENQEAIFFNDGQALDLFGPGRYTLKTQNIPLLSGVLKLVTGGRSPFHCQVYFINKSDELAIKWGTDSRIRLIEPEGGTSVSLGASGEMAVRVADSRKMLIKLVGTDDDFTQEELQRFFRGLIVMQVKSYLAQLIKSGEISIHEIDEKLDRISDRLTDLLRDDFAEYGLSLERFLVTKIVRDERVQYCENCGAPIIEGSLFCDSCGAPVAGTGEKCPVCGYVFVRPGNFCPGCGARRGEKS